MKATPRDGPLLTVDAGPQHSGRNQAGYKVQSRPIRIFSNVHCATDEHPDGAFFADLGLAGAP